MTASSVAAAETGAGRRGAAATGGAWTAYDMEIPPRVPFG
jgi:hypothetical protein